MNRFLGTWYEAERYFTVSEVGSRCVTTNYLSTPEGRIIVSNEIINSLTGYKRVMEGSLQMSGREGEGRILVKYSSRPIPYDSEYTILDTDYDNYAVMWSCSGIGPVHTQNTWLYTRERIPSLSVMQSAYSVLEKFRISRTFFVKSDQADCSILPDPVAIPLEAKTDEEGEVKEANDVAVKKVEPVVKDDPEVPLERSAVPEQTEESEKPMQVPELIMAESEKKDEMIGNPKKGEIPEIKEPKKESESSQ